MASTWSLIQKPLLVIQGANDPRVLKVESGETVAAAKKSGLPVEYVVFPGEGHGFAKRKNNMVADEAIKRFVDQRSDAPKTDAKEQGQIRSSQLSSPLREMTVGNPSLETAHGLAVSHEVVDSLLLVEILDNAHVALVVPLLL